MSITAFIGHHPSGNEIYSAGVPCGRAARPTRVEGDNGGRGDQHRAPDERVVSHLRRRRLPPPRPVVVAAVLGARGVVGLRVRRLRLPSAVLFVAGGGRRPLQPRPGAQGRGRDSSGGVQPEVHISVEAACPARCAVLLLVGLDDTTLCCVCVRLD